MSDELPTYQQALERLARGEEIMVLDDLAHAAEATRAHLASESEGLRTAGAPTVELAERYLNREGLDQLMALGLPLVTYGGTRTMRALAAALTHVGRAAVSDGGGSPVHLEAGTAIVGRLLWGLTAQGLAAGNADVLLIAREAALPTVRGERKALSMAADPRLRYAALCQGDALLTYKHYREWLGNLDLVSGACPYLAADLEQYLQEADFIFALVAAEEGWGRTSAQGLLEAGMLVRLVAHLRAWPRQFAKFLGVGEESLADEVARRAALLHGPGHPWPDRSPLFGLLGVAAPK